MARAALPLLALLPLLPVAAPAHAADAPPAAASPDVELPEGVPVGLDGDVIPAEWDDAAVLVPTSAGFEVRAKQVRGTLLLALRLGRPWPASWHLLLRAVAGPDDARYDAPGAVVLNVEPYEHNRPHALLQVRDAGGGRWVRTDGQAVARFGALAEAGALELAVPLATLGVTGDEPPPLRWCVALAMPRRTPSLATFPAGLHVGATQGGLPADLARVTRWAKTTRFPNRKGAGAFARSDWDAWVAADRELTARGEAAHRKVLELLGTFDGEVPTERAKDEAAVEATALAGLRAVAAREPWTRNDLRAYAQALQLVNRPAEALGVARALAGTAVGAETAEDLRVAALVARDAEDFEASAAWWDRAADGLPEQLGAAYRREAERMRAWGAQARADREARRADEARDDLPLALLETSKGVVLLRLLEDDCPESVRHFVHLVEATKGPDGQGFYDGTRFHRVVGAGIAQGGDPSSRGDGCATAGAGGSPWWIPVEKNPRHGFFRGAVGWAMALDMRVRSQFFVMTAPKPSIAESGFCVFATVAAGMEVVDRLDACDELRAVRILRKRAHPYEPKKGY